MSHSNASAASLVSDNLALISEVSSELGVLDLACGSGRNGLFLLRHHIPVTFADNNESALREVELRSKDYSARAQTWLIDLELPGSEPLSGKQFDAILVFNYLHRPLMNSIQQAVKPGGLILYETFTVDQPRFGKPTNPDYLLQVGELSDCFSDGRFSVTGKAKESIQPVPRPAWSLARSLSRTRSRKGCTSKHG